MPEMSLWGLVISLLTLAISCSLKASDLSISLKRAYEEIATLRKQLDILNDVIKNNVSNHSELDSAISIEIHNKDLVFNKKTGTWVGNDNTHYCPACKGNHSKLSPLMEGESGWKCPVCNAFFRNPDYQGSGFISVSKSSRYDDY